MGNIYLYSITGFILALCSCKEAVPFDPSAISTPEKTTHEISFTKDGKSVYYTQTVNSKWSPTQIGYNISLKNGIWSKAKRIDFTDTLYNFSISPDGMMALFSKDNRTWMSLKEDSNWSAPIDLNAEYEYVYNGGYYHIMEDYSFYFSSIQDDEGHPYDDIYFVDYKNGQFDKPTKLGSAINTEATEFSPWVNNKRDLMIFSRYDGTSEENKGIFISRFIDNNWQKAKKINTLKYGWGVFVVEETNTLYYTANGRIETFNLNNLDISI